MLLCLQDLRDRQRALSMAMGAGTCAALHPLLPEWSLLAAGLGGGTAGWLLAGRRQR